MPQNNSKELCLSIQTYNIPPWHRDTKRWCRPCPSCLIVPTESTQSFAPTTSAAWHIAAQHSAALKMCNFKFGLLALCCTVYYKYPHRTLTRCLLTMRVYRGFFLYLPSGGTEKKRFKARWVGFFDLSFTVRAGEQRIETSTVSKASHSAAVMYRLALVILFIGSTPRLFSFISAIFLNFCQEQSTSWPGFICECQELKKICHREYSTQNCMWCLLFYCCLEVLPFNCNPFIDWASRTRWWDSPCWNMIFRESTACRVWVPSDFKRSSKAISRCSKRPQRATSIQVYAHTVCSINVTVDFSNY